MNDGSTDILDKKTGEVDSGATTRIATEHGARVIEYPDGQNRGKGYATKTGMLETTGKARIVTDADMSYSPDFIGTITGRVLGGEADIAVAMRAAEDAAHEGLVRRVGHWGIQKLCENRLMAKTDLTDPQAGAKAFSAAAAEAIWPHVTIDRFAADRQAIMIARYLGMTITEDAATIVPHGDSRVSVVKETKNLLRDSYIAGRETRRFRRSH